MGCALTLIMVKSESHYGTLEVRTGGWQDGQASSHGNSTAEFVPLPVFTPPFHPQLLSQQAGPPHPVLPRS